MMKEHLQRVIGPSQPRSRVTAAFVDEQLCAHVDNALYDELQAFGELMLDEVTARTDGIDSKAMSALGWTSALLALFVWSPSSTPTSTSWAGFIATLVGAAGAAVALVASATALRVRQWDWPSQHDWFRSDLFGDVAALRRYHLLTLLETHEGRCAGNERKVHALKIAQLGLLVAGAALVAQLIVDAALRRALSS